MVLVAHHLVCDGLSFGIVLRDLAVCYSALVTGRRPELPEPVSAVAFAEEARSADQVEARAEAEEFWLSQFKELPDPLDLPADRPRADVRTYNGERVAVMLPLEIERAVKGAGGVAAGDGVRDDAHGFRRARSRGCPGSAISWSAFRWRGSRSWRTRSWSRTA